MRIGLTGTIASGKSFVASILEELGAVVIDTDNIARIVVEPDTDGWKVIVERWGKDILLPDGTVDRKKLAEIVFTDSAERKTLNAILHPLILKQTLEEIRKSPPDANIVLLVPLLFETGFERFVDSVWTVTAPENTIVQRLIERDAITEEQARARISAQMPDKEKTRQADVVIDNGGTREQTRRQVIAIWRNVAKS
ncbi:MAG: dephospho-CoA kinase [bacterium]